MPIDAGIYSQQILPPALDPAKIQAGVIAQQDQLDAAKAKQQDLRDSLLARSILQSTGGDFDKAIPLMMSRGLYGAAQQLQKDHDATAKARGEAMKQRLENDQKHLEMASDAFSAAGQDPSESSFKTLITQLNGLPDDPDDPTFKQRMFADLGPTYDPVTTPAKLKQWSLMATNAKDQNEMQLNTVKGLLGDDPVKNAGQWLSDAKDAADYAKDYQALMASLPMGSARTAIQQVYPAPSQVTDQNFDQVKQMATARSMTNVQAATLANTAATEENTQAYRDAELAIRRSDLALAQRREAREAAAAQTDKSQAAVDKAYNASKVRLDALRKPLDDTAARMSRLVDTVNQGTPQADALIAPELMTVMAGGMGSGLRLNEAEISRVIGGRSNLESLKAALNKWQTDPSKALSVTPAQREQIRALISDVGQKADAKIQAIQQADADLLDAKSVSDQRRIIVDIQKKVEDLSGPAGGSGSGSGTVDPRVAKALSGQRPGIYKLSDGKSYQVNPDGSISGIK